MGDKATQSASPAEEEDVTKSAAASTAAQDDNPDSSPGSEAETEETFGDVIGAALNPKEPDPDEGDEDSEKQGDEEDTSEEESGKESGDKAQQSKPGEESEDQSGEESEDDDGEDLEKGQHVPYDRFKKVIDAKNEYKGQVETLTQERDQYQQGHRQFEAIQGFMRENELQTEDVVEALQIAAAINNDPARAAQMLAPKMETLQRFTGDILPEDLQQRVDQGELPEEAARELARRRNQERLLSERSNQEAQRRQQQDQTTRAAEAQRVMASAANAEQKRLMESDPDWDKKDPWVRKELHMLINQRRPATAEQASALVREAYDNVNRDLKKLVPEKQEVRPGPSSSPGGGSPGAPKEPETMSEAIKQALAQDN